MGTTKATRGGLCVVALGLILSAGAIAQGAGECAGAAFTQMNASFEHMQYRCATEGWSEWATPQQMKYCNYPDTDLDEDGIPEQYAFALLARARCQHPDIETQYQANFQVHAGMGGPAGEAHGMAGFATMSQNCITWLWTNCLQNNWAYHAYNGSKTAAEPLSASGDFDGDGYTNRQEYQTAVAAGGDLAQYGKMASDPGQPSESECAHAAFMHMNAAFVGMQYRCATEGWSEWATPQQKKFCGYPDADLDEDGIPEKFAFALLARARCQNPDIEAQYQANFQVHAGMGGPADEAHGMAGFATMSQNCILWLWTNCWQNGWAYQAYNAGKTTEEPLSATGDYDGDGLTNLDEYLQVIAAGGDEFVFADAASDPTPFWEGNPAVPVAGVIGLGLLLGGLAAGGALALRRRK